MLYVFQMDVGRMLTLDTSWISDTVANVQVEIAKVSNIPVEKQILLVSGGRSLSPDKMFMYYGAGMETSPVFLFTKQTMESRDAPVAKIVGPTQAHFNALKLRVKEALNMPPSIETVKARTKVACEIRDMSHDIVVFCDNDYDEQQLQSQGWHTVMANVEEIALEVQKTETKFLDVYQSFLPDQDKHFCLLDNFGETIELLDRIPLLKGLKQEVDECMLSKKNSDQEGITFVAQSSTSPSTLLEWINTQGQGQSLEALQLKCYDDLHFFSRDKIELCLRQVQEYLVLVQSDPNKMKQLSGIERRLSELDRRLGDARKSVKEQKDLAQGFLNIQQRLGSTQDAATVLPDICKSHYQQLQQMYEREQRLEALSISFRKSKHEMCINIHNRLSWVMHIETEICKLDSELIYHMKTLKVLECNLSLLNQVKAAPKVYADMVVEAVRRKFFSSKYLQWANTLADDSRELYKNETDRRLQFARKLGEHFLLNTLFRGFDDMPTPFATTPPSPFDFTLPNITMKDIETLKNAVPELEEYFSFPVEFDSLPHIMLNKGIDSPFSHMPHSQSSQTDWSEDHPVTQPCVIQASEAPAATFTLPEMQESTATEYSLAVSSLTERMKDVTGPSTKQEGKDNSTASSKDSKSSRMSPAGSEAKASSSSASDQPVKSQTKTSSTHTDSTSPVSSNEFATADFYFEDSMPSPKEEKGADSSKSEADMVASLQTELAEKMALIEKLQQELKERDLPSFTMEKRQGEREGSSDSSSTIQGAETTDQTLVSDTSDPTVTTSQKETATSGGFASDVTKTVGTTQTTDIVTDVVDQASSEIDKLKASLADGEKKLQQAEEEKNNLLIEKETLIKDLEQKLQTTLEEMKTMKSSIESKNAAHDNLEKALNESKTKAQNLEVNVKKGEESLERVKSRLVHFRDQLKKDIPSMKQNLKGLKDSVLSNKSEMDQSITAALNSVEKQVNLFNSTVLADANAVYCKEKESLLAEIQQLKVDLHLAQSESTEKTTHLTSANKDLTDQIDRQIKESNAKLEAQRRDFDAAIKDLETKNALELELEVDKCRAELKENLETVERNLDKVGQMKDDLIKELEEVKVATVKEREKLEEFYEEKIKEIEKKHAFDKETVRAGLQSELDEQVKGRNSQVAELEAKLEALHLSLSAEKKQALEIMKEQMVSEHAIALEELKQQVEDQKTSLSKVLEQKQLDFVTKLTDVKAQFDVERNIMTKELNALKDIEKADIETQIELNLSQSESQTGYDLMADVLAHSETQTGVELMAEGMTHSETQTGLELLAEVISLTSSASYGSEEMIAHKLPQSAADEKESKETPDQAVQMRKTIDEMTSQLSFANEKIVGLEAEVGSLIQTKKDLDRKLKRMEDESSSATGGSDNRKAMINSYYQEMLQTGNTTTSFMVMENEPVSMEGTPADPEAAKLKDQKIASLEKRLMEMSMTTSEREVTNDKVSIRGCDRGDLVLLCLDERHDQYVVFTVGTHLHFLHSESLECLGLKIAQGDEACRKSWILAEVVDKEYCLAKKPHNRFRVPQGTCFYRVKCKPWRTEGDAQRQEKELPRLTKGTKPDHSTGTLPKKSDKK